MSAKNILPDDSWIISPNKEICGAVTFKDKNAYIACVLCDKSFSQIFRKHHCRGCGEVMCGECARVYKFAGGGAQPRAKIRCCSACKDRVEAQHRPSKNRRKSSITASMSPNVKLRKEPVLELVEDDGYDSDSTCTAIEKGDVQSPMVNPLSGDCSSPRTASDLTASLEKENVTASPMNLSITKTSVQFKRTVRESSKDHPLAEISTNTCKKASTPASVKKSKRSLIPPTLMSPGMFTSNRLIVPPDSAQSDKSYTSSVDSDDTRNAMGFLCFLSPSMMQLFRTNKSRFR